MKRIFPILSICAAALCAVAADGLFFSLGSLHNGAPIDIIESVNISDDGTQAVVAIKNGSSTSINIADIDSAYFAEVAKMVSVDFSSRAALSTSPPMATASTAAPVISNSMASISPSMLPPTLPRASSATTLSP